MVGCSPSPSRKWSVWGVEGSSHERDAELSGAAATAQRVTLRLLIASQSMLSRVSRRGRRWKELDGQREQLEKADRGTDAEVALQRQRVWCELQNASDLVLLRH